MRPEIPKRGERPWAGEWRTADAGEWQPLAFHGLD